MNGQTRNLRGSRQAFSAVMRSENESGQPKELELAVNLEGDLYFTKYMGLDGNGNRKHTTYHFYPIGESMLRKRGIEVGDRLPKGLYRELKTAKALFTEKQKAKQVRKSLLPSSCYDFDSFARRESSLSKAARPSPWAKQVATEILKKRNAQPSKVAFTSDRRGVLTSGAGASSSSLFEGRERKCIRANRTQQKRLKIEPVVTFRSV